MRKFEIINPSDKCFLFGDNLLAVSVACLFLGEGRYALREMGGDFEMPIFLFGGHDEWLQKEFGTTVESYLISGRDDDLAAALESFQYDGARSSMNNIGARAKSMAESIRAKQKQGAQP